MTHGEQFLEATQCKSGREGKDRKTELRKSTEGKKKTGKCDVTEVQMQNHFTKDRVDN